MRGAALALVAAALAAAVLPAAAQLPPPPRVLYFLEATGPQQPLAPGVDYAAHLRAVRTCPGGAAGTATLREQDVHVALLGYHPAFAVEAPPALRFAEQPCPLQREQEATATFAIHVADHAAREATQTYTVRIAPASPADNMAQPEPSTYAFSLHTLDREDRAANGRNLPGPDPAPLWPAGLLALAAGAGALAAVARRRRRWRQ